MTAQWIVAAAPGAVGRRAPRPAGQHGGVRADRDGPVSPCCPDAGEGHVSTPERFVDYQLRPNGRGSTAMTQLDDHVRDLIERLLFTAPGERVNRPGFGTGLLQLVFLPNSEPLAAATKAAVRVP